MKKLFNSLLVFALVCCFMCDNVKAEHKITSVELEKTVELDGGTLAPKEDFMFTMTPAQVEEGTILDYLEVKPGIDLGDNGCVSVNYDISDDVLVKKATFDLSQLVFDKKAAIYRYEVKEQSGDTLSITYDEVSYIVDVFVTNEGFIEHIISKDSSASQKQSMTFTNIYETESLDISKEVKGIFADKDKDFTFRLTLNEMSTLPYGSKLTVLKTKNDGTSEEMIMNVGEENVFTLKHNESISLQNIPEGMEYFVSEDQVDGYTSEMLDSDLGVMSDDGASVHFTNTKMETVDTGVMLDVAPYILSIGTIMGAYVILVVLKKKVKA